MAASPEQAAAVAGFWVDQASTNAAQVTGRSAEIAVTAWAGFTDWYNSAAVAAYAAEISATSAAAQEAVAGMFTQYVAELTAAIRDTRRVDVPRVGVAPVRGGADPVAVHSRPAGVFRETFALTGDEALAVERATDRARQLMETDTMLAARQAQVDSMLALGVERYRRVLRPELSDEGPCGLCVAASDRIYRIKDLLPIHGRCKCVTMLLADTIDPAAKLNREDLQRLYGPAGGTAGEDLKRIRVQVRQHGEMGPVLVVRGQRFTGPDDLNRPDNRDQTMRQIQQLQSVLDDLMKRPRTQQLGAALAYQREQLARRRRRVA